MDVDVSQPDTAPQAKQSTVGAAGATQHGQAAPTSTQQGQHQKQQAATETRQSQQQKQQQDVNPFRNLGNALESWRADLSITQEAQQQAQQNDEPAAGGDAGGDDQPVADEYQFLGANDQDRSGTTQALAPATEEQAKQLPETSLHGADGDDQQPDEQAGAAAQQDQDLQAGCDDDTQAGMMSGAAPQQWAGSQRNTQLQQQQQGCDHQTREEDAGLDDEEPAAAADMESGDMGQDLSSIVTVRLAETSLLADDEDEDADGVTRSVLPGQLSPEDAAALRQQLDERLRQAATGMVGTAVGGEAEQYGREMWARCEALTAGLASELTEQLRLILEPTLASRLAGDYRTGKRLNMKKVIGYIASHYRKDKIWMRRTRPDKRKYQVQRVLCNKHGMQM